VLVSLVALVIRVL